MAGAFSLAAFPRGLFLPSPLVDSAAGFEARMSVVLLSLRLQLGRSSGEIPLLPVA